ADADIVVESVEGPGEVFIWTQDEFLEIVSLMRAGAYRLPATISQPFPAHTHAAWAFTEPGRYLLTVHVDVRASNGGTASSPSVDYIFEVGGEALPVQTVTTLAPDATEVELDQQVSFTATVAAAGGVVSEGAVQFRNASSGVVLGHAPLGADGTAVFRVSSLQPGDHRIVAEFVPDWSDDFAASASGELAVTVRGDHIPEPEFDDGEPVGEEELGASPIGLQVTGSVVRPGGTIGAQLGQQAIDRVLGDWISVWAHPVQPGQAPQWLGWVQPGRDGRFSASLPEQMGLGDYRLVVKDRDGGLLGWDRFTATDQPDDGEQVVVPPSPKPTAPAQECRPAVTLDHGHIDAFTVSVGAGRASMQIWEDVTGHRVLREPETVLLRVKEQAYVSNFPAGVPGGPSGYLLPLTQNPSLIWPGWDTNRTRGTGYEDVSINVSGVSGPGQVHLYTSQRGGFGWRPILTHGGTAFPGTIRERDPAHTHAQWVFSEKGVYVFTVHAVASDPDTGASLRTLDHTYVFQVGDVPLGDVFCGLTAHGAGLSALVNAAVNQAGLDAVAASQAEAEGASKSGERAKKTSRGSGGGAGTALEALLSGDLPAAAIAGIVGGGVLVLAGIAGGTVWMIRRMGEGAVPGE
ncbi:MAG: choice-of-anchor M domain-containing protein, partial [Leucobacter sp.]